MPEEIGGRLSTLIGAAGGRCQFRGDGVAARVSSAWRFTLWLSDWRGQADDFVPGTKSGRPFHCGTPGAQAVATGRKYGEMETGRFPHFSVA